MSETPAQPAKPEDPEVVRAALQRWTEGDQAGAVEVVRPAAEAGQREALALIAWFQSQRGEPYWRDGVPFAERAAAKGMPWVVNYYLGNMLGDPGLRGRVPDLLRPAMQAGFQFDPVAHAQQPWQQGDHATALRIIDLANLPYPYPESWDEFLQSVRTDYEELGLATGSVGERRAQAEEAIERDAAEVEKQRTEVTTRTQQLLTLIKQTTNAEVQSFFDSEATRNEGEARVAWRWAVGLLGAAAVFAVAPIVIYYVGSATGHKWLTDQNLIAAHLAPAIALGAVAGVLLARARGRDRARQRARDLSVALGTMFVYSGQIANEDERQRFLHDMGRVVIESFLRQDAPQSETDSSGLLAAMTRRA